MRRNYIKSCDSPCEGTGLAVREDSHEHRLRPWFFAAFLALLTAPACPAIASKDSLAISGVRYLGDLPTLVADKLGLFEAIPAPVTITYERSGHDNMARLRAGEIDVATMALTPLVIELLAGPPAPADEAPVILADLLVQSATGVYRRESNSDSTAPALAGKRIGYMPGTNAEVLWWDFTSYHGLDRDSFQTVEAPVGELARQLASGNLDAAVLWQPWPTLIELDMGVPLVRLESAEEVNASWVLVTRAGEVARRPETMRALLTAYRRAIDSIEKDPAGANELLAGHLAIAPALTAGCWQPAFFDLKADWALLLGLQKQLDWFRATGRGGGGGLDYQRLLQLDPLARAHPAGISIMFDRYLDPADAP